MKLIIFALAVTAVTSAPPPPEAQQKKDIIPIVKYENEGVNADGSYSWSYETGNNIIAHEQGTHTDGASPEESKMQVSGGYEYTDLEGKKVQLTYIADENGFQPQSDILPTPPPIPPAIVRLLEWLKAHPSEEDEKEENKV